MCQELFRVGKTDGDGVSWEIHVRSGELVGVVVREGRLRRGIIDSLRGKRDARKTDVEYFCGGREISVREYREHVAYCASGDTVIDGISVAENIFLGDMSQFTRLACIDKEKMMRRASAVIERAGIGHVSPAAYAAELTHDQRRLIALSRLMRGAGRERHGADIMILDDVLFSLSSECRERMSALISDVRRIYGGGVMVTRDADIARGVCDRIQEIGSCMELGHDMLMNAYACACNVAEAENITCETVMRAVNICSGGVLSNISFKLYRGEVLGFFGAEYSGIHRLGRVLFGYISHERGRIYVRGHAVKGVRSAMRRGVIYIGGRIGYKSGYERLFSKADIYILDMDIFGETEERFGAMLERIACIRRGGGSVILISDDAREHILLCDRIKVISGGREVSEVCNVRGQDAYMLKERLMNDM